MKMMVCTNVAQRYWQRVYERFPGLDQKPYAEQHAVFEKDGYFYAGALRENMAPLGYEVLEVWSNIKPIQKAWAEENGVPFGPNWVSAIPMAQAKKFQPDVLYSKDGRNLNGPLLDKMQEDCPSLKIVTGFIGALSYDIETFQRYDCLFTCLKSWVDMFGQQGIDTHFLQHSFAHQILERIDLRCPRDLDVLFTGAIYRRSDSHMDREKLLEGLLDQTNLHIYSAQADLSAFSDLLDTTMRRGAYLAINAAKAVGLSRETRLKIPVLWKADSWTEMPMRQLSPKLHRVAKPPVYGLEMFQLLRRAQVVLNTHGGVAQVEAANMRLFEATGVGSCQLTDHKDNLHEYFEIDREIVTYKSEAECLEKVRWLMEHPKEREAIALAGQQRTLRDHTHAKQCQVIDGVIRQTLDKNQGRPRPKRFLVAPGLPPSPSSKENNMKILYLTEFFAPEPTGANHGLPLSKWLLQRDNDLKVVTTFPNYPGGKFYPGYKVQLCQKEDYEGVPVLRVPVYPSHDGSAVKRILTFLSFAFFATVVGLPAAGKADVSYVADPIPTVAIPAIILKLLRGVPMVFHVADVWPDSVTESGMIRKPWLNKLVGQIVGLWLWFLYRNASAITVLAPGVKQLLIRRGVPADKIHVVYDWIDEKLFQAVSRSDENIKELGFDKLGIDKTFNVVYAGNLGAVQGLDTVIRAATLVRDTHPQIRVLMVGTGAKEQELRDLADSIGASNVVFFGRQPYESMPKYYTAADVLVIHLKDIPLFETAIPSKTQVSLASGRPILLAIRGDAASIIEQANCGVTAPPENPQAMAEAMVRLYETPLEEREAMGRRGRQFYDDYMCLEKGATTLEGLLQQAAGKFR